MNHSFASIEHHLRYQGRWEKIGDGLTFDHACNQVSFCFEGQGDVSIQLNLTMGGISHPDFAELHIQTTVTSVGKPIETCVSVLTGKENETTAHTLPVAKGLPYGIYRVDVMRLQELCRGQVDLCTLTIDGTLLEPPAQKQRYIEVFGDSYIAGYGNLCERECETSSSAKYSDATKSFAYQIVRYLDADYSIVAYSGLAYSFGMGKSALDSFYTGTNYWRKETTPYHFTRQPDMVITDLGTNDFNNIAARGLTDEYLYERALIYLQLLREKNKTATIVWAYGVSTKERMHRIIQRAVAEFAEQDGNTYFYPLKKVNCVGGHWHPSADEHRQVFEDAVGFVETLCNQGKIC